MKNNYYSDFRFNRLTEPKFRHILMLLYWPLFSLVFQLLEHRQGIEWIAVRSRFDGMIPFCEYFIIPYYFWFVYLVWMLVYTFFFDIPSFKKYMTFIIISYSLTCLIYVILPTEQNLRIDLSERSNVFEDLVWQLQTSIDNNKNVCPSLHVTGSFAVLFTAWNSERYRSVFWRAVFIAITVLISASTVFLKQHSIIDIAAAVGLCFAIYPFIFRRQPRGVNYGAAF